MDPRLLRLYNDELAHLRDMGGEFAAEFPKIAARLGMESMEVADPYVERLLEGFAFLSARVQMKLEAEHPRLVAHLLESTYPNFLAPVPSMLIARLGVDVADPNLAKGFAVPRGSPLVATVARGQDTHCQFTTAHAVTLWPIELQSAQVFSHAADLPLARLPQAQNVRFGLRLRLSCGGGARFSSLGLDRLALYIAAPDDVAFRLHELLLGACVGTLVRSGDATPSTLHSAQWRGPDSVRPLGFAADEALLPESLRAFSGYRLLQEAAALPQRFLFVEIGDLAERLADAGDSAEIIVLFNRADVSLEAVVDASSFALHCTPAINLFVKRVDRIQVSDASWEHHVVADRTRPLDFEVHSIASVLGFGTGTIAQQPFQPLYSTSHDDAPGAAQTHAYYTVRRQPRVLSARQRQQGTRSSYIGEEVYLSLVDPQHAPYREDLRQLSITARVSNRDLPLLLPPSSATAGPLWRLDAPGPVLRVDVLRGPSRPISRRPVGELGWHLINHLTLNHLSLVGESPSRAATTLRDTLLLYAPPEDAAWRRQVEGVQQLSGRSVVRRLPFPGPLTFGSGVEIVLELDELAFQGASAFLFASVLERFFARFAAINSFTQLTLRTVQRGEVMRWAPSIGRREVL
ncbi:MAG: type VI secretion system baseplate subunit TssF [Pseudomonadota bacterium]|nr:type VI secretion system baseplate subunit TssF [Pseudomonadota bacterium]